jgi:AcrR family transcriptional regulator
MVHGNRMPTGREAKKPAKAQNRRDEGGRDAWLAIARKYLIRFGISSVKVERLANARRVTRGGFYWQFKNLDDLLSSLLIDWEVNNSSALLQALRREGTPGERFGRLVDVWIEEDDYDPAYDLAVREWALTSKAARAAIVRVDARRIAAIEQLMLDAGFEPDEARVRARVTYYHQVGYYAMREKEPKDVRRQNAAIYRRILTGLVD